ncbi:MAG: XDD4 family exosortase-dependent surface protein [Fimbriimonadaceae bacterium]
MAALAAASHAWTALFLGAGVSPDTSNSLSAKATFQTRQSGGDWFLDVVLTNTSLDASGLQPADVLTGLFWTSPGSATLAPVSASLDGSPVWHNGSVVAGHPDSVGGEWAFRSGLAYRSSTGVFGASSAGLALFGPFDRFDPAQNLAGPTGVGGLEYGLLPSLGAWPTDASAPVAASPLTSGGVKLVFWTGSTELPAPPSAVWAQYGTSLTEPYLQLTGGLIQPQGVPVPEPLTLGLTGAALAVALRRRLARR